jgi:hypothetical protein
VSTALIEYRNRSVPHATFLCAQRPTQHTRRRSEPREPEPRGRRSAVAPLRTSSTQPDTAAAILIAILVKFLHPAGVAELADARDSKSRDLHWSCGFDPHLQHHKWLSAVRHSPKSQSLVYAESDGLAPRTSDFLDTVARNIAAAFAAFSRLPSPFQKKQRQPAEAPSVPELCREPNYLSRKIKPNWFSVLLR